MGSYDLPMLTEFFFICEYNKYIIVGCLST